MGTKKGALLFATALTGWAYTVVAQQYNVTDLGSTVQLGDVEGLLIFNLGLGGHPLNASGQVAATTPCPGCTGEFYSNGSFTTIPRLGQGPGTNGSEALGINDNGQVVGASTTSSGATNAYIYRNGSIQDIGTLSGTIVNNCSNAATPCFSVAVGINNSGQVTGQSGESSAGIAYAFLYSNGSMNSLGVLGAYRGGATSAGTAINASGEVTGYSTTSTSVEHAFLYSNGTMVDLGILGGGNNTSVGTALNSQGQVVGWSATNTGMRAFLYSSGSMQNLGLLATGEANPFSIAYGINDGGQVVGISTTAASTGTDAFLYSQGQMIDLNGAIGSAASNYQLTAAYAINNDGQILAEGTNNSMGTTDVLLLTPAGASESNSTDGPVPLWALGALGGGLLGIASRRLKRAA